jgi:translation initiation factor 2A
MDFNVKESHIRIIDINGKVKYEKKMHKTSEIDVLWSPNGKNLLINKGYHEDNTG